MQTSFKTDEKLPRRFCFKVFLFINIVKLLVGYGCQTKKTRYITEEFFLVIHSERKQKVYSFVVK